MDKEKKSRDGNIQECGNMYFTVMPLFCRHCGKSLGGVPGQGGGRRANGKTTFGLSNLALFRWLRVQVLHITMQAVQVTTITTHIVICFCFPSAQGPWQLSNILFVCYCTAAVPRSRVWGSFSFEMISHAIPRPWSSSKSSLINLAL